MSDKPAILKDTQFTVEEGAAYRVFRTGAIWMNKLFFSCLFLLAIWLAIAGVTGDAGCVDSYEVADQPADGGGDDGNATAGGDTPAEKCTVWLTPTAKYLGAMSVLSFLASLLFGALGLMVGKRILETTAVADEVGARRADESATDAPADAARQPAEDARRP